MVEQATAAGILIIMKINSGINININPQSRIPLTASKVEPSPMSHTSSTIMKITSVLTEEEKLILVELSLVGTQSKFQIEVELF